MTPCWQEERLETDDGGDNDVNSALAWYMCYPRISHRTDVWRVAADDVKEAPALLNLRRLCSQCRHYFLLVACVETRRLRTREELTHLWVLLAIPQQVLVAADVLPMHDCRRCLHHLIL